MGPAFISAAESASPQSSITPGNARLMTVKRMLLAREREHAGRQPLGPHRDRQLERAVLAREPGQRAGLGIGDLGMVAGIMRGLGEQHRAEGAGRQEHDLAVGKMRRKRFCDIGLRGAGVGQRISSVPRTASSISSVMSAERRLAPAGEILDHDDAAGGAVRRHGGLVAPPQPHLVSGEREIARRRERAISSAQNCDTHQRALSVLSRFSASCLSRNAAPCRAHCAATHPRT